MHHSSEEKRSFSRIDINSRVRYRLAGEREFREATLDNVSATGVLLWTDQQNIVPGTKLFIVIESDKLDELPIEITATVVRNVRVNNETLVGYGCQIEQADNAD